MTWQKSTCLAYLLWLTGGIFGLHHVYLGRFRHAFTWWCTCGGFGHGWFRDLWRIPDYVAESNQDHEYVREEKDKMRRPLHWGGTRFCGELLLGLLFGVVCRACLPEEVYSDYPVLKLVVPSAVALGVHTVANIGNQQASLFWALVGAYLPTPFYLFTEPYQTMGHSTLLSAIILNWRGKSWRLQKQRNGWCKRFCVFLVASTIYSSLWTSAFINNAHVTTSDGQEVPMREALKHLSNSPFLLEPLTTIWYLWIHNYDHTFGDTWWEFVKTLDPEGEQNAYKVLGITPSATEKEIRSAYRAQAKQWHPDNFKNEKERQKAEEKFIHIAKAYDTLSVIKSRRNIKNEKSVKSEKRNF